MEFKKLLKKWSTARPEMKFVIRVSRRGSKYVIEYDYYWLFITYTPVLAFEEMGVYDYVLNPYGGMKPLKFKTKESAEHFTKRFKSLKDIEAFQLEERAKMVKYKKKFF